MIRDFFWLSTNFRGKRLDLSYRLSVSAGAQILERNRALPQAIKDDIAWKVQVGYAARSQPTSRLKALERNRSYEKEDIT